MKPGWRFWLANPYVGNQPFAGGAGDIAFHVRGLK